MSEAMQIIKDEVGPDAVIMSSRQVRKKKGPLSLFSKKEYEVRVGFEEEEIPKRMQPEMVANSVPVRYPSRPAVPDHQETSSGNNEAVVRGMDEMKKMIEQLSEQVSRPEMAPQKRFPGKISALYQRMVKNGVEAGLANEICIETETIADSRNADPDEVIVNLLKDLLGNPHPIEPTKYRRKTIMLVGPTGVGKTTTLIKLAYMLVYREKLNIGIVNADSFRVAAKEHIKAYCEILKTDMITIYKPEELKDALDAFADKDMVLIDTAGKVSDDKQYLMDLAKLINIGKVDDIYITLSAATSERVLRTALKNYSFLKNYSIIVTKTDEAPDRGVFLYLAKISGRPLSYLTTGQNVPDDIKLMDSSEIAESILEK